MEAPATPATPVQDREATFHDYIAILYRRRYVAIVVLLLTIGYAVWSSLVTPPRYSTAATLVVEQAVTGFERLSEALEGPNVATGIGTLAEILKSRSVATRALKRAGLDTGGVDSFRRSILVTPVRGASVIAISVVDRFPNRAALLANAVSQEFIELSLEVRKRQAVATREFLEDQVAVVGREVASAENRLLGFKVREGNIDLSSLINIQVGRLADFETQRILAGVDQQVAARRRQEMLRQAGLQPKITSSSFMRNPSVNPLRSSLVSAEIDLALLRERFTEEHPAVIAAREKIAELRATIGRTIAQGLEPAGFETNPILFQMESGVVSAEVEQIALQSRAQAMAGLVDRLNREIAKLPSKELELARLSRDLKIAESTFLLLSQRYQDARIAEASVVPEIRILDEAEVPSTPIAPNMQRNVMFGTILGLVFGVGAAMGADYVDRSIRTPEDAERATGLPVLAVIPSVPPRTRRRGGPGEFEVRGDLLIANHSSRRSSLAEAFRGLRTSLMFSSPDRPLRTILVTSALPGEGKTTVAANLALSFAQLGRKVWLIEADLRRQQLAHAFPTDGHEGLVDYLVDAVTLPEAVKQVPEEPRLAYVPVGSLPPNPSELIGSQKMRAFLDYARGQADIVLCDSAPLVPVADSLLLAPEVDGVILVVEVGRVPRDALHQVYRRLVNTGAHVLGVVLSKVRLDGRGYGYGYGTYYGYYGYGEEPTPRNGEDKQ